MLDGWYEDLYGHVLRVGERTDALRDDLTTRFEAHLSLLDVAARS